MSKFLVTVATASLLMTAMLPAKAQPPGPGKDDRHLASIARLDMDAVPDLNQDVIRQVQQGLQTNGFAPGPIDGILGPLTRNALVRFQDRYGIEPAGEITNQTLFALGKPGLAGEASNRSGSSR